MNIERELQVLELISNFENISQRKIAHSLGFSLGLTNQILKKLIKKGYVKIKYLNRKKLQYILTPKGFVEKLKKSYSYATRVISEFTNYSNKLSQYIISEYEKGYKNFTVKCNSEIISLVKFIFHSINFPDIKYKIIETKEEPIIITNGNKKYIKEIIL